MRIDIHEQLLTKKRINCGRRDIILSGGPEYRLSERVSVRYVGQPVITDTEQPEDVPHDDVRDVCNVPDEAVARRQWILQQLAEGRELKAPMVVNQFKCSVKTAQRDLRALKDVEKIEYVGTPRTGYYSPTPTNDYADSRTTRDATRASALGEITVSTKAVINGSNEGQSPRLSSKPAICLNATPRQLGNPGGENLASGHCPSSLFTLLALRRSRYWTPTLAQIGGARDAQGCRTKAAYGEGFGAEVCPSSCTKNSRELREVGFTEGSYAARRIGECRPGSEQASHNPPVADSDSQDST